MGFREELVNTFNREKTQDSLHNRTRQEIHPELNLTLLMYQTAP